MKNLFKSFVVLLAVMAAVPSFAQKANNTLTEKEKKQGWTLLFNGKILPVGDNATIPVWPRTG